MDGATIIAVIGAIFAGLTGIATLWFASRERKQAADATEARRAAEDARTAAALEREEARKDRAEAARLAAAFGAKQAEIAKSIDGMRTETKDLNERLNKETKEGALAQGTLIGREQEVARAAAVLPAPVSDVPVPVHDEASAGILEDIAAKVARTDAVVSPGEAVEDKPK